MLTLRRKLERRYQIPDRAYDVFIQGLGEHGFGLVEHDDYDWIVVEEGPFILMTLCRRDLTNGSLAYINCDRERTLVLNNPEKRLLTYFKRKLVNHLAESIKSVPRKKPLIK